jgi:type VI secretion system protein ImpL
MSEPSQLLQVLFTVAPPAVFVLAVLLIVLILFVVWRLRRQAPPAPADDDAPVADAPASSHPGNVARRVLARLETLTGLYIGRIKAITQADAQPQDVVRRVLARLETLTGVRERPYLVPWIAVIGTEGTETSALVQDLEEPAREYALPAVEPGLGCSLHLRRQGIIVEVGESVLSDGAWLRRWKDVVRMVRTHRPDRPLDGIVVAVPAASLLGEGAQVRDRLARLGEQLYQVLWSQQTLTGLRTPIWLLVTGSEALAGFVPFARALPAEARDDILGWSSPYGLDTAFAPAWADDGIAAIVSGLSTLQLQILMADRNETEADRIFFFPAQIADLAHRLRLLLTPMLRTSAYHEAFLFRGFYFTGRLPAEQTATDGEPAGSSVFLKGLFDEKVFREYRLARPAAGSLTRRQRSIRWAQVALLVLGVVGGVALADVMATKERIASIRQLVETMAAEVSRVRLALETQPETADAEQLVAARRLAHAMSGVTVDSVETWSAPTSKLTDADVRVKRAIADAYDVIILKAIWSGLTQKLRDMLGNADEVVAVPGDPSFGAQVALDRFGRHVDVLTEFDRFVSQYQSLRETRDIKSLAALVDYTFDVTLLPDFRSKHHLYLEALEYIRQIDVPRYSLRQRTEPHLREMMTGLYGSMFAQSPLQMAAQELVEALGDDALLAAVRDQRTHVHLARLRELVAIIDRELSSDAYEWLARRDAALGGWINERLARLANLSFVAPDFADSLRGEGRRQMTASRAALLKMRVFGDRPIIVQRKGRAILAPDMRSFQAAIDELFMQHFALAARDRGAKAFRVASDGRLSWDPKALREGLAGAQEYLAGAVERSTNLPAGARHLIQAAQQELVSGYVDNLVDSAAQAAAADREASWSIGEEGLRVEVLNFAASSPLLASLRDSLDVLGFSQPADRLRAVVGAQAVRLLREVDALLGARAPYRPLDPAFAGWAGLGPLAGPAFGASSVADLAVVLALRREYIERLARDYAQPAVEYLDNAARGRTADDALVAKWILIIRAVQRYQLREPSNSIERLEQFILTGMDQINLGNCLAETGAREHAADYFGEQLASLRQAVGARCLALNRAGVEARYERLHAVFNDTLAGRFPFVGIGGGSEPLADRGLLLDADPNDVRRFFQDFAREIDALPAQLREPSLFADTGHSAATFLNQLDQVRRALAPMLADPTLNTPLAYEVVPEFRTNIGREAGGNQIIQWSFTIGNLDSRPLTAPAIWTIGDPVTVSLRWARNAPQIPLPPNGDPAAVDEVSATFTFTGPWSLLALAAMHAPPHALLLSLPDRRPEVLYFAIPLKRNPQAAPGGQEVDQAEVYMRLGLTAVIHTAGQPDRRETVTLPFFPAAAPDLVGGPRWLGGIRPSEAG